MRVIKLEFTCNKKFLYQNYTDNSETVPNVGDEIWVDTPSGKPQTYKVKERCFCYKEGHTIIPDILKDEKKLKVPHLQLEAIVCDLGKMEISEFARTGPDDYE